MQTYFPFKSETSYNKVCALPSSLLELEELGVQASRLAETEPKEMLLDCF